MHRWSIIDTPIRHLTDLFPDLVMTIVAIIRDGKLTLPRGGSEMMAAGDRVYFVCDSSHLRRAMATFGHEEPEVRSVVIAGGGAIGQMLAGEIESNSENMQVQLIERSAGRARELAEGLRTTGFSMAMRWTVVFLQRLVSIRLKPLYRLPMMTR